MKMRVSRSIAILGALALVPLSYATLSHAQENLLSQDERGRLPFPDRKTGDIVVTQAPTKITLACDLNRQSEVVRYHVTCTSASYLDTSVADCCISNDHWEVKTKSWDSRPNTSVTTSPGRAGIHGLRGRVYNYGGTPHARRVLRAEIDCSYLHGVNVFPATSFVNVTSNGACNVQFLGARDAINRTP